jgi:hypothetical protein
VLVSDSCQGHCAQHVHVRTYDSRVQTVAGAAQLDLLLLDDLLGRHVVLVLLVFVAGETRLLDCVDSRRSGAPLGPSKGCARCEDECRTGCFGCFGCKGGTRREERAGGARERQFALCDDRDLPLVVGYM